MTYQIFALYPQYDDRDAIIGTRAYALDNIIQTKAYGLAKLYQLGDENTGGGVLFRLVPTGASPFELDAIVWRDTPEEDLPF